MMDHRVATNYKHVQTDPSDTWVIEHNLFGYPVIDAFVDVDGTIQKVMPASVTYTSNKICTLVFAVPRAGFAVVS
jgi:hypothetical protein